MVVSIIHYWYGVILVTIARFFRNDNMALSIDKKTLNDPLLDYAFGPQQPY
jgi:hypothetical protein